MKREGSSIVVLDYGARHDSQTLVEWFFVFLLFSTRFQLGFGLAPRLTGSKTSAAKGDPSSYAPNKGEHRAATKRAPTADDVALLRSL